MNSDEIVGSTGMIGTPSMTTVTFGSGGIVTPPTTAKKMPVNVLGSPTKMPKKLLVAFLDENDEVQWCAKVHPSDISVTFDRDEFAPQMELTFWLIDAG